jgi:hypothetical protein
MEQLLPGVLVDDVEKVIAVEIGSPASEALNWVAEQYSTIEKSVTAQLLFTVSGFVTRYKLVEEKKEKTKGVFSLPELRDKLGESTFSWFSERLVELDELVPVLRDV